MILTDREIRISIERGLIEVDPIPGQALYSSTAVDLTLDKTLSLFKERTAGLAIEIDPSAAGYKLRKSERGNCHACGDFY